MCRRRALLPSTRPPGSAYAPSSPIPLRTEKKATAVVLQEMERPRTTWRRAPVHARQGKGCARASKVCSCGGTNTKECAVARPWGSTSVPVQKICNPGLIKLFFLSDISHPLKKKN
ncbi:hypothetical protein BRADI_3g15122v3 [Brachypodium distachyon]|uniref:Uncharacterized protein n=1 Tax=Brachypodium distachyon TaxID=15368 RepID=A0A2K2CXA3_BRADI|nr:hypothetical protein BRADI_3g15122v3 [Brachypodium distachyon]